jgi:hypothetical protein
MGSVDLVFDTEKQLFSLPVVVVYGGRQEPIEMYVDSGASVSMVSIDVALRVGVEVDSLPARPTGGVSRSKHLRTLLPGSLMIVITPEKVISPEVRVSEPVKDEKSARRGPMKRTRTVVAPAVNLFGLNSIRECRGRLTIDASQVLPVGRLEWE